MFDMRGRRRFVGMVLGVCASCVVALGVTADVAFAQAPALVDLWNFTGGNDGGIPQSGVIQASDGNFYGTTPGGGVFGGGTFYRMDASGTLTTLHSFSVDTHPQTAGLIQASDGSFYGTTEGGGAFDFGTVFKIDASGTFTTLHSFSYSEGTWPQGGLIQARDGNFYGITSFGGSSSPTTCGFGTVFRMDASGALTTLHVFQNGSDGANPFGALVQASDGNFYGTTASYCDNGNGTVFKMDASGTLTTLHTFNQVDGSDPRAALIQATDGSFYGTTVNGGAFGDPYGFGTIFKIDASGTLTTLHSFNSSDGSDPVGGLIQASDGNFYGTTGGGGAFDFGTVFEMDASGTLTTLHSFNYSDGSDPEAGVVQASDGSFYGTTYGGGAVESGVIFWLGATGNTPIGSNIFVMPATGFPLVSVVLDVTTAGNTTATSVAATPPSGFTFDGVVWDISTTATYIPPAMICLPYHSAITSNPHLYHYVGGSWVDITTGFNTVTQVVCGTTTSFSPFAVLVPTPPPPPSAPDGRMFGMGHLDVGGVHHHFAFRVSQLANADSGRLEYWVNDPKRSSGRDDDDGYGADDDGDHDACYGRDHRKAVSVFQATAIASVTFLDDPAFQPGTKTGKRQPTVDTVTIAGTGKWNGKSGYTFIARATDEGEPGRHRDTFSIVVSDARGTVVASVAGDLDGGNIQSTRLLKR